MIAHFRATLHISFMEPLSVLLPACNEEGAIASVLQAIRQAVPEAEIIVIDDGSNDRTGEIAAAKGVRMLRHALTVGAGKSVKDGIEAAQHDRIVMLDSDGTYPADCIPELLLELDRGFDLVIGARRGEYYHGNTAKFAARTVFRLLAQFATGRRIPDINSGMRAFRKSVVLGYFPHLCNGFSLPTTMTLSFLFTGRSVTYVPIEYKKRIGKSKVHIVRDTLRTLQYITESIAVFNPTKLYLLLALLTVFIGAVGGMMWDMRLFFVGLMMGVLVFGVGVRR